MITNDLLAERVGFEPTLPCGKHAFQACAFSHSAISPTLSNLPQWGSLNGYGTASTPGSRFPPRRPAPETYLNFARLPIKEAPDLIAAC